MKRFHWISTDTGELQHSLLGVLKTVVKNYCYHHVVTLRWKFSLKGF